MGQTVKVDGEQGTITQIQPMKLSDTPTYKIRMKSGKEIWRYEEEIGNKKVGNATDRNGKELKVGDMVAVKTSDPTLNHGRIVKISGDQISVDVTGEDDIWTTPARQAVKMG